MYVQRQLGGFVDDLVEGGQDLVEHTIAGGGEGMDFTAFALVAGTRFKEGDAALTAVCDKVCGRLGTLLASVGGFARVIRNGFAAGVRGGAATFDRLDHGCRTYRRAKTRLARAKQAMRMYSGKKKLVSKRAGGTAAAAENARRQVVLAETNVVLAQKMILEALGGSLITASTQEKAEKERKERKEAGLPPPPEDFGGGGGGGGGGGSSDEEAKAPAAKKSSTGLIVGVGALGVVAYLLSQR